MGAAWREPRRGEIPVERSASRRLMTSYVLGCRGQKKTVNICDRTQVRRTDRANYARIVFTVKVGLARWSYIQEVIFSMERKIKRGDMFFAELAFGIGSEQSGFRPVLIIQNDVGNKHSSTVIVAIITSRTANKAKIPTHCHIKARQGLGRDSLVLLEQIRTIDKARLNDYIGTLNSEVMSKVDRALAISVGLK